jgi:uncharacterized protein YajQ (UPF0234 family)
MRLFYQIYYDGFSCLDDNTKIKIMSAMQTQLNAIIDSVRQDSHQFIVQFRFVDNMSQEELKIGNYFVQVSSGISADTTQKIFNIIKQIIPDNVENYSLPF